MSFEGGETEGERLRREPLAKKLSFFIWQVSQMTGASTFLQVQATWFPHQKGPWTFFLRCSMIMPSLTRRRLQPAPPGAPPGWQTHIREPLEETGKLVLANSWLVVT